MKQVRFWNEEYETLPREAIRRIQLIRLRKQIAYAYENSPFYRRKFDKAGLEPGDIKSLEDVSKIPFTVKEELRDSQAAHPPWGDFLCIPPEDGVRVFQTSGTTGEPLRVLLSRNDWYRHYYEQFMHFMHGFGITRGDTLFVPFGYGLYIAWWGFQTALEQAGVTIVPGGAQSTKDRVKNIFRWKPTVICGTPTYLLNLGETAIKMGTPLSGSDIRIVVSAGEPGAQVASTKKALEEYFGAECFDDIGSTEITNFGYECMAHQGTHLIESMFYAECLDLQTLKPVAEGEVGELVLTNLCTESMPLIRYRIKDLVRFDTRPCDCGRTFLRLDGGIIGRADDMFQFAGVNIYPSALENLIREEEVFSNEYQVVVPPKTAQRHIRIRVEPAGEGLPQEEVDRAAGELVEKIKYRIGITPDVEVEEPGKLPRFEGKAKRLIRE